MPTKHHINFLEGYQNEICEPILITGSKIYDYDNFNYLELLNSWGLKDIVGIDLDKGRGVDEIVDITDSDHDFFRKYKKHFNTVICTEILTHVDNPFLVGQNLTEVLKTGGFLILSDPFVRKESAMPQDLWRFTFTGFEKLFPQIIFDKNSRRKFYIRDKKGTLYSENNFNREILSEKNQHENSLGNYLRRLHKKIFSQGIFNVSRHFPETGLIHLGKKKSP